MTHNYNLRNLPHREKEDIEIKIKLLDGNKYDFTVNKNISLMELFAKTSIITNIDCIAFYFVKNHRRLPKFEEIKDWMTLKDFNFKHNHTNILNLVLRLGGPMEPFKYNKKEWFDT